MKNIFLVFLLAFTSTAYAQRIDFEEFPHDQELQGSELTLLTKGFAFLYNPAPEEPYPTGFQTVGPLWQFNGRSAAMNPNSCSAQVTMAAEDLAPFAVRSIDLAELNGDKPVQLTFVGTTPSGVTLTHRVSLRGRTGWKRYVFPIYFWHLQKLEWHQGDCIDNKPHMFDNIVVYKYSQNG